MDGRYQILKKDQSSYEDGGLPMKDYVEKVYQLIGIYKQSLISNPMCKSVDCFYPEGTEEKASEYYLLTDIIKWPDHFKSFKEV